VCTNFQDQLIELVKCGACIDTLQQTDKPAASWPRQFKILGLELRGYRCVMMGKFGIDLGGRRGPFRNRVPQGRRTAAPPRLMSALAQNQGLPQVASEAQRVPPALSVIAASRVETSGLVEM
jgi:hypothetical protein